jgi:uncharacterized membrane protein YhfC
MTVSPIALVGGLGMIVVALAFFGYAFAKRLGAAYVGLGALAWLVTVAVKVAIALPANGWVHQKTQLLRAPWGDIVFNVYIGLLTGITEVAMVWLFLRYTRFGRARWPQVVAFGIGFGAFEALLVGLGSLLSVALAMAIPDKFPKAALDQIVESGHLSIQLAPISERFFAVVGHLATNVMLFYGASRRAPRWFWLAFVYKSAIDAAAAFYLQGQGTTISLVRLWTMEVVVAVWSIAGLLIIQWIARRYVSRTEPAPTPLETAPAPGSI